jgi:hypothetical protein
MNLNSYIKSSRAFLYIIILSAMVQNAYGWKFLVCGDSRGNSSSQQVNTNIVSELAHAATNEAPAFILCPGDLVYSSTPSAFAEWRNAMAPAYNAGIPVYPVMGNHELGDPTAFTNAFGADIPDNGPPGEINRTYAIGGPNALILALDTYVNAHRVNQEWIDSIIATNIHPHVFAIGHEPAFKVLHTDTLDDYPANRDAFWRCLANANASAYFCGHDHFFDHSTMDDGDGNSSNDIQQYIVGTGGAPLYGDGLYDGINSTWTPQRITHEVQYGYTVIEINDMDVTITWKHRIAPGVYEATSDIYERQVQMQRPIISIKKMSTNVVLHITRLTPNTSNTVERCSDLKDTFWLPVTIFNTQSNNYEYLTPVSSDRQFYKVKSR